MDELWQRFRAFWIPVLWGTAVFLVGLIVVHMASDDPDQGMTANDTASSQIKRRVAPTTAQIEAARSKAEAFGKSVTDLSKVLDERRGVEVDPYEAPVEQALRAAVMRGGEREGADGPWHARREDFDGDADAARQAEARCQSLVKDRVTRLRSLDPNVSWSQLKADVVSELAQRANRADVEVVDEEFGLGAVSSVDRAELPRRLLNLALVATVLDLAIRQGVRSIDAVTIQPPEARGEAGGPDAFISEWPVKIDLTGTPQALTAILNLASDPAAPIPLGTTTWKASGKKDGLVKAETKFYSVAVKPDALLGLEEGVGEVAR